MACILLWSTAVTVHDPQAYRKMDVTRERISRILELKEILLSFQTGFNLDKVTIVPLRKLFVDLLQCSQIYDV